MDDIAVIGIGLRFPGDASSPEVLWKVLESGQSQWSEIPSDRMNIDGYFHPSGDRQGSISFRGGHFLKDDVTAFDAPFFAIPAEDAKAIDPQQRLLLEVSYEALENAGQRMEDLDGSNTSVYVGSFVKDYEQVCLRDPDWQPQYAATGNGIAIMANRISYFFNLHGPSMTLDTGCSGSLVSIHLAAQSLRTGESALAIAAGAGMILTPNTIMPMTALNFLSPDGRCFTFDHRANGYGRGEGIGVVVLKRLSDAVRDNDPIRAVIRGSAVNQDGRTTGITLPSKEAQVANIKSVYEKAGLDFDQTAYVECHGTGTQAGDWRELKAISETLALQRPSDKPIFVGSVKPNIGHLEGSAGVAGMIKGVLMLEHGKIPPNINFEKGNPDIDFEQWKVKVPTGVLDWPLPGPRRLSVNCFGFGGTNAHVVLDQAPSPQRNNAENGGSKGVHDTSEALVFCFSAQERAGLKRLMEGHIPRLESLTPDEERQYLVDYSYTLGERRSRLDWKASIVANSAKDLITKIRNADSIDFVRSSSKKAPKLCFVFSGQGSQWPQMGKDLLCFAPFRDSVEAASQHLHSIFAESPDLLREILREPEHSQINEAHISQPATTAIQIALVDLMKSFAITPDFVIGHSSGEIAAAYASGALSREYAWETAYLRGRAAESLSANATKLKGAMMVVGMSFEETEDFLLPYDGMVQVACINSSRSITVSGDEEAIFLAAAELKAKKIFHRLLKVTIAYHSSHMKLVEDTYRSDLAHVTPQDGSGTRMFSTVTGQEVNSSALTAEYWARNMVSPVDYVAAVQSMMALSSEERPTSIIELSPTGVLRSPTQDILSEMKLKVTPSYDRAMNPKSNNAETFLTAVGQLWCQGFHPTISTAIQGSGIAQPRPVTDLPPYPWNHERTYWHESHLNEATRFRKYGRQDLIGAPTADSIPFEPRWRGFLRISENPWIQDHQVQKTIVYPASGMVAMVLEGAQQMFEGLQDILGYEIKDMHIEKAMVIPNTQHGLEVALNLKDDLSSSSNSWNFAIYAKQLNQTWERHASGTLHLRLKKISDDVFFSTLETSLSEANLACGEQRLARELYELLDDVGMNYGTLFKNITSIRVDKKGRCFSEVQVPDTKSKMPAQYEYSHLIHPATLDSMIQTLFAIEQVPMVPTFIKSIFVSVDLQGQTASFNGCATAKRNGLRDATASIVMKSTGLSNAFVSIEGLQLKALSEPSPGEGGFVPNHRNLCTEIVWKPDVSFNQPLEYGALIDAFAHKKPNLSVLQVGGGFPLAKTTLRAIAPADDETPCLSRYTIAENQEALAETQKCFANSPLKQFLDPKSRSISDVQLKYDLIVCFEELDAEDGSLTEKLREDGLLLRKVAKALEDTSSDNKSAVVETSEKDVIKYHDDPDDQTTWLEAITASMTEDRALLNEIVVLVGNHNNAHATAFCTQMKDLTASGHNITVSAVCSDSIILNPASVSDKIVISLLDVTREEDKQHSVFSWSEKEFKDFASLHQNAKFIMWLTRSAHMNPTNPKGAPIVALARSLMSEDPLKTLATFDLSTEASLGDEATVRTVLRIIEYLSTSNSTMPGEVEFAERDGQIFIPRLKTLNTINRLIENSETEGAVRMIDFYACSGNREQPTALNAQVNMSANSRSEVVFTERKLPELQSNEVAVKFSEALISPIETSASKSSDTDLSMDMSGTVTGLGTDVTTLGVGHKVTALVSGGAMASTLHIDSRFVKVPRYEVSLSVSLCTYFSLAYIGNVGHRRKVLIQAGASTYGFPAVQAAMSLGAEVFATVFGEHMQQQADQLLAQGIAEDHIISAETEDVAVVVKSMTNGKGVDLVYNPTLKHFDEGIHCARSYGNFVQFASAGSGKQATQAVPRAMTYVSLNVREMLREDPDFVADLLDLAVDFTDRYLPTGENFHAKQATYRINELAQALEHVEKSPYLGSVIVATGSISCEVPVVGCVEVTPLSEALDPNATYVLSGGLGGLGRTIADLLVDNGVRHVAFLGRSGAASDKAKDHLARLRERGVDAHAYAVDVCDREALQAVIGEMSKEMPPIKGMFQCAAIYQDSVFENMTYGDWNAAIRPKTIGSWNLVETVSAAGHNAFSVFLASSASVVGNRGQSNYAAGNGFQDALARSLRLQGKQGVSLNLGPMLRAGVLVENEELLDMLRAAGFYGVRHEDFVKVLHRAILGEISPGVPMPPQVSLGVGTGGLIRQNKPADPYWTRTALFSYLNVVDLPAPDLSLDESLPSESADPRNMLSTCADADAAAQIIATGLTHMLAKAMNMLPEELSADRSPSAYGVDSLIAVGVRNWVLTTFGEQISVFDILSERSIMELAELVAEKGGFGTERNK